MISVASWGLAGLARRIWPDILFAVNTRQRAVALTFDDGPTAHITPRLLDVLRKHGATATFFLLGAQAAQRPDLVTRIRNGGHELGNHLWSDVSSRSLSLAEFERQLLAVEAQIARPAAPRWFRPGHGLATKEQIRLAARHGYRCCLLSVYSHDFGIRSPGWISGFSLASVFPGAIVVLHDGPEERMPVIEATDRILRGLRARGYRGVSVGELVAMASSPKRD